MSLNSLLGYSFIRVVDEDTNGRVFDSKESNVWIIDVRAEY